MPRIDLVRRSEVSLSTRARQLASMFELEERSTEERWSFDLDLPDRWSVGLIVGPSGSGKTTVGREVFAECFAKYDWPQDGTLIDGFDPEVSVKDAAAALSRVGFSSPPAWLRPYHVLSNGQKFRADMARLLVDTREIVAVDEFTSVVDRDVARIGSAALGKAVRSGGRRMVAISCHDDIIEWLQPDWVLHMPSGKLDRRSVRRHPPINITIQRVDRTAWDVFRHHHYLDHSLSRSAACFVALWNERPVAFASAMSFPHPTSPGWREHRTVCLPDFQGVGIGNKLSEVIAAAYAATGKPYRSTTSHPAMVRYRAASRKWKMTRRPSRCRAQGVGSTLRPSAVQSRGRYTAAFNWVGPADARAAEAWGLLRVK